MVSKKEKYLTAAQKFIERGQNDKALAEYAKVVQEDPKDTRTWLKMAELHAKRGANTEASDIYLRTGDLYVEQGFAQKAVAVYKNVLKLSPGTVPAHLKVAALFNQLGLVSDAIQQFEMAATALQGAGKSADAVTALRQAVELQPENVVLRVKVAEAASHAGMVEDAVREFATAAEQLKAQGRGDEAARVLERLLFHQPDNHAKARELAELYIAKGTPRLALPKLQGCLNAEPRDPHTLSLLAKALERLGQAAKAVSVLKELVHLCDELGRSTERDAAVLRGLTLDPSDGELLALGRRYQVRAGAGAAAGEATPPPLLSLRDSSSSDGDGGGDEMDGSGSQGGGWPGGGALSSPLIVGEASGRVLAPLGMVDSGRPDWAGVSIGATPEVSRILAEAEVFVKYGLLERAADHLPRIFDIEPDHREGREKLIGVLQRLGRHEAAGRHAEILERQTRDGSPVGLVAPSLPPAIGMSLNAEEAGPEVLFDVLPIDVDLGGDLDGVPGSSDQSGNSLAMKSDDGADSDRAKEDRANDDKADLDAHDPAADVITPPPEIWDSGHPADLAATEFDAEVRTADVLMAADTTSGQAAPQTGVADAGALELPAEVEFSIDEAGAEEGLTGQEEGERQHQDNAGQPDDDRRRDGDADGQSTPPLVRTPMVIASPPRSFAAGEQQLAPPEEEEDPTSAFAEEVPTAVGDPEADPEVLTSAFTTSEEEELSAELDQVSFFLDQAMVDEARSLLHDLETRYPGDARVAAALRDLQARERVLNRGTGEHRGSRGSDSVATSRLAVSPTLGSTVIERPSTSSQSGGAGGAGGAGGFGGARGTPRPRAVMTGDETSDSATHADLAIAYKGMGLLDAAIAELKLLAQDESQEVFALTTMGECFEGKSSFTEAIIRYKRALNCEQITREETILLYFLLGAAFEHLGDVSEALYFYEKVLKRNPKFRDVDLKVAELRPRLIKRAK